MLNSTCAPKKWAERSNYLANILLHQFGTRDADEGAIGVVRNGTCKQGFARPRWSIEENALGLRYAEGFEKLGVLDGQFDDLGSGRKRGGREGGRGGVSVWKGVNRLSAR